MNLPDAFRLSFYLTLGLACCALTSSDLFFLPYLPLFLIAVLGVLGFGWHSRERIVINEQAANHLGVIIGLLTLGWILFQLPRTERELVAGGVSYPAGLLPHVAPLLMLLLCVKIFRPKTMIDFWALQTIGLMMATLGCVLGNEPLFGILLAAYIVCLVWCLTLFYQYREMLVAAGATAQTPLFATDTSASASLSPWPWLGVPQAARCLLPLATVGMTLFFVAPRYSNLQWEPQQLSLGKAAMRAVQTGIEDGMDLNRVGKIELSQDPAFFVEIHDAQGKPASWKGEPRWRVEVLDHHARGRWRSLGDAMTLASVPNFRPVSLPAREPKDLDHLALTFQMRPREVGGLALAEPIDPNHVGLNATIDEKPPPLENIFFGFDRTDAMLVNQSKARSLFRYRQLVPNAELATAYRPARTDAVYKSYLLTQAIPKSLSFFAVDLARRVCEAPLPNAKPTEIVGRYDPEHHEAVARALCRHLAESGEYEYSLEIFRQDITLDATSDFLINIKKGHCERYASGLCLMLRALGVPSRVIRGYRGMEEGDREGEFLVRQAQAHSWVEVLLTDREPAVWITLDPTPSNESAQQSSQGFMDWLIENFPTPDRIWREYIMRVNGDTQMRVVEKIGSFLYPRLSTLGTIAGVILGLGLLAWWLHVWRRSQSAVVATPSRAVESWPDFYQAWITWLHTRWNIEPTPSQTPLEFAETVRRIWAEDPAMTAHLDRPVGVARLYYGYRFGGLPTDPATLAELRAFMAP